MLLVVGVAGPAAAQPETAPKFRFASQAEGTSWLTTRDRFVQALSPFDRQSRLATSREVAETEFLKHIGAQVLTWKEAQSTRVTGLLDQLRTKLEPYQLPLPEEIVLIHTTGREEGRAAYCRRNAIILPRSVLRSSDLQLERLLAHELFHVLSTHATELRQRLYAIIGFRDGPTVELPPTLRDRKITNPDGPLPDCYLDIEREGARETVVPVLYSSSAQFDPAKGDSFFPFLVFRLMVVEKVEGKWQPKLKDEEPILLEPKELESFYAQIGRNTDYIYHPDEILAVNFVHLLFKKENLATPRIVNEMRELLAR